MQEAEHIIGPESAATLPELFQERVRRSPEACAYRFFDAINGVWTDCSWNAMAKDVARCRAALAKEKLKPGDKIAIMARNSRYWVIFDQAALSLGLIVVPVYTEDRADNVAYILDNAEVKLLVIGGDEQWQDIHESLQSLSQLKRIITIAECKKLGEKRLLNMGAWLPIEYEDVATVKTEADELATIVYTSGTTGRPKGVMLSHRNILSNCFSALQVFNVRPKYVYLSFLPLSHTLERTVGYYLPMMGGATVAHARGIPELAKDLQEIKPHGLISVPRIYERVYAKIKENLSTRPKWVRRMFHLAVDVGWQRFEYLQGRAKRPLLLFLWPLLKKLVADRITQRLGGNLLIAVSGGAALSPEISKVFVGLGVPIFQGYGLTESSPIISTNRLEENIPDSIGKPLPGIEVRIGDNDELFARGENIMLGYWKNQEATDATIDKEGWLATGDKARIENDFIYITGRIKDIIVLANGEKVSPVDMELAIASNPLFDQVMIIGESRPYLVALSVLNPHRWKKIAEDKHVADKDANDSESEKIILEQISKSLHDFPGYAQIYHHRCDDEAWTVENGLLTPTLKMKRKEILLRYKSEIEQMYEGHTV
ncbi:MAG: long-chain fatty acid--CoA ligase [Gammaproteobacteria bacterium]|jgi:long-chain acyl-CoA synthetase|nr:long-chain fatty acid--CoA ligase [Gammaproteobacteria bacterium]